MSEVPTLIATASDRNVVLPAERAQGSLPVDPGFPTDSVVLARPGDLGSQPK
jgi:hypothetical protein